MDELQLVLPRYDNYSVSIHPRERLHEVNPDGLLNESEWIEYAQRHGYSEIVALLVRVFGQ